MKSNNAKGLLDSKRKFNEQGTEYHYDDVLDIIKAVEQKIEEAAIKAYILTLEDYVIEEVKKEKIARFRQLFKKEQND